MRERFTISYIADVAHANPFKYGIPKEFIVSASRGDLMWQMDDVRDVVEHDKLNDKEKIAKIEEIFAQHKKYQFVGHDDKTLLERTKKETTP